MAGGSMKYRSIALTVFFAGVLAALVTSVPSEARVKVYLDESRTDYIMADELDCRIYEGKSGMSVGFIAKLFVFNVGPSITLGKEEQVQWDRSVHGILARYKELCNRFNAGAITMEEYQERLEQIDALSRQMMELQRQMVREVKQDSRDAFRELDSETRSTREKSPQDMGQALDEIQRRLDNFPSASPGNHVTGSGDE